MQSILMPYGLRLAEAVRQPLRDQARDDVGRGSCWIGRDDVHRPRRTGLRSRDTRAPWLIISCKI